MLRPCALRLIRAQPLLDCRTSLTSFFTTSRISNKKTLCHAFVRCSVLGMSSGDVPSQVSERAEKKHFSFGPYEISCNEVFLTTEYSYAFVNLRPVLPGHVLVSSRRVVPRFLDLTYEETTDLWLTAKRVGAKLQSHFNATALTFTIQDGPQAGQTVPHVHIHILPRKPGDFEKADAVYDAIDEKEREMTEKLDLDKERKDRTRVEMEEEARVLRGLFQADL